MIVLVALFFVSGADAASLVMGMLSSHGNLDPPRAVTVMWGVATGAAAAILLLANGLTALQQAAIIAAAPFTLVMIGLCISVVKGLGGDAVAVIVRRRPGAAREEPRPTVAAGK